MRIFLKIFLTAPVFLTLAFCTEYKPQLQFADGGGGSIKVLELFTSEGCSSCPPADALMNKLVKENKPGVFVLTYHVDYWNRLGWKDSFSDASFTERQNLYAAKFNNQSVYTPQLVVNGTSEFTGSDEERLNDALGMKDMPGNPASLEVEILNINKDSITFKYSLPATREQVIHFALVQTTATTKVKRGENGGRTLNHSNIVRSLKTAEISDEPAERQITFDHAPEPGKFVVIAFVQGKKDMKITHAELLYLRVDKN